MGLLTALIYALIYIVIFAIVVYLIIWILSIVGVVLPPKVIQLLWVLVALIAIVVLLGALTGHIGPLRLGATGVTGGEIAALPSPTA